MGLRKLYKRGGLTKPQWDLLCAVSHSGEQQCYTSASRLARKLWQQGLVAWDEETGTARATAEGRQLVADVRRRGSENAK